MVWRPNKDSNESKLPEGEERPSGGGDDENGKYPIGFRFKPTTEELVEFYLLPKLLGEPTVPNEFVIDASAYECDPEILTEKYKERGVDDDTWYFLSPRNRKYPGGGRPVRRTADKRGRWKPSTGQSKPSEEEAGASTSHSKAKRKKKKAAFAFSENTLAYYVGTTKDEAKTKWLMHELVVPETPDNGFRFRSKSAAAEPCDDNNLLNRYVMCRIYVSPLKKWKEIEEVAADVTTPTSSQSSGPALPECVGEAAARAPSSPNRQRPAKRPAVERPAASGRTVTGAPNKGGSVSQAALFLGGGRSAPARGNGGGSSVRMPAVGAGAAGRHGPGMPALVHWPPVYNSMQGPVQLQQQPPLVYGYGNRAAGMANAYGQLAAPGQGPPVSKPRPPHRDTATAPNSQGPKMMMRPPVAAGQPARLPSPRQQPQPPTPETDEAYRNRVYAILVAEMKLKKAQQDTAARAGQQRIDQTPSAQPACSHDEGANANRPVGVEAVVPPVQFPAPHGGYPYRSSSNNLAQRPQRQQSSSAAPAPAAVEKAPAAENVPSKQSAPPGANEGSCKGDAATATIADNIMLQILTPDWTL